MRFRRMQIKDARKWRQAYIDEERVCYSMHASQLDHTLANSYILVKQKNMVVIGAYIP
jgi:hypothetical protein